IPDPGTGVFHGCDSKKTGALRLIDPAKHQKCAAAEKAVTWNQTGQRGATVHLGVTGPAWTPGRTLLPNEVMFGVAVPDVLSATGDKISSPSAVAFDGTDVWIANSANSLTE